MCQFFSLVSDGKGKTMYFDWKLRKQVLDGKLKDYNPDSHTSIADYFGHKGAKEDKLNKYEYNPLTGVFIADQINTTDDRDVVEKECKSLDFSKIVKPLIIKKIIHPFKDIHRKRVSKKHIELLKTWASVGASVGDGVWASVGDGVRDSMWDGVWDGVRDSVGDSVGASVRASVRASVWDSMWDSMWASVWAYISSFFLIKKWKNIKHEAGVNPFQSCIDLWEDGIVPSYDGKVWRLHGDGGKVLKEIILNKRR